MLTNTQHTHSVALRCYTVSETINTIRVGLPGPTELQLIARVVLKAIVHDHSAKPRPNRLRTQFAQ